MCHRVAPVDAVVAAVLVLGREHKQVLVFGVEQLHRIHHVDESRGCGIATETVDVRRFCSSVIRMQFLVLRNRGADPQRKVRKKILGCIFKSEIGVTFYIFAKRLAALFQEHLGQHENDFIVRVLRFALCGLVIKIPYAVQYKLVGLAFCNKTLRQVPITALLF